MAVAGVDTVEGDAVLSVEMIEAIGVNQFGTFAQVCNRLLKPGGRAVIQVITAPAWSNAVARTKRKNLRLRHRAQHSEHNTV